MILPIVAYGDPVLRKVSKDIDKDYPDLDQLIENMWETMYASHGVGLAAPQIGRAIRLFVIDTEPFSDDEDLSEQERSQLAESKMVFINAKIIEETGEEWSFNEGCLSIPDIREEVMRQPTVTIEFCDENFEKKTQTFDGILARVIQHEYD
ncbi:MAG: peptide deformylase, partial [Flavobacteriaceae bacterium]|nr:peptide deformylase [Flavobacteriaceae bacterium]